jgi:hypothetical protein
MKGLLRLLVIVLAVVARLLAQPNSAPATRVYSTFYAATPSGGETVLTIQQPATNPRDIRFLSATVFCSVSCTASLEMNGSAATSAATAATKLDSRAPAATSVVFAGSNSTGGTVINQYEIAAGSQVAVEGIGLVLGANVASKQNISIRISAISSGSANIWIAWLEGQ